MLNRSVGSHRCACAVSLRDHLASKIAELTSFHQSTGRVCLSPPIVSVSCVGC
jgi:hypothetical protein